MELRTPQYCIVIIPPCPRCGTRRPWRDGRHQGRQRWRCRTCRFTWVERPWHEAQHRQQGAYRIVGGKFIVTRRAEAAFKQRARLEAAMAEAFDGFRAELEAALEPIRAAIRLGRAVADTVAAVMRFDTSRRVAIPPTICPRCGSPRTVRDGHIRGKPRRRCRVCRCRFVEAARWRRIRPKTA